MPVPTPEPSTTKTIIETLLKPFTVILNRIAERIGDRLKAQAPAPHLRSSSIQCLVLCMGWQPEADDASTIHS